MKPKIGLISTGGTIEKTYNSLEGILNNQYSVLDIMLTMIRLEGIELVRVPLMNKDSLDLTDEDLDLIVQTAHDLSQTLDGVVIVHGTDRLAQTGELLCQKTYNENIPTNTPIIPLNSPIVLTGAMQPFALRETDALQNLTEALLAVQLLQPGVYVAMHNKVLSFPGPVKDYDNLTFT